MQLHRSLEEQKKKGLAPSVLSFSTKRTEREISKAGAGKPGSQTVPSFGQKVHAKYNSECRLIW